MMALAVIIPFKAARQKSRLSGVLDASHRKRLSLLMLESVLAAVADAGLATACYLVSSDKDALGLAKRAGGTPVAETGDRGVNAAVSLGLRHVRAERYLVMPADLPMLTGSSLRDAMALSSQGAGIVISPSRQMDGTNLLLFPARNRVPLSYDRNSFWNHLEASARLGYSVGVYTGAGAVFDIDTAEDLALLARMPKAGRTARFAAEAAA